MLNQNELMRVLVLRKRMAWLKARISSVGPQLSHDRSELAALGWALQTLTEFFPEIEKVQYSGELRLPTELKRTELKRPVSGVTGAVGAVGAINATGAVEVLSHK